MLGPVRQLVGELTLTIGMVGVVVMVVAVTLGRGVRVMKGRYVLTGLAVLCMINACAVIVNDRLVC